MTVVRVIALGNEMACDDGAALVAARRLKGRCPELEVILAGRPGPALLDLLDPDVPTVLLDVVRIPRPVGQIVEMALADVAEASIAEGSVSSHGFGLAETLRLNERLERPLPRGLFIGIAGRRFEPGEALDPVLAASLDGLVEAVAAAAAALAAD